MLAVAVEAVLGRAQHVGEAALSGRPGVARRVRGLYEARDGRLAVAQQGFGVELDAARGRVEAAHAGGRFARVLPLARVDVAGHAFGPLAQLRHRETQWLEDVIPPGLQAAAEECVAHAEALREVEQHLVVGTRFPARRHHALAQLHPAGRAVVDLEADAQAFALPGRVDRQQDVGVARGRRLEQVAVHVEFELRQRLPRERGVGLRDRQVGAEGHHRAHLVRRALDDRAIGVARGHPAMGRRPDRPFLQAERLGALRSGQQRERIDRVDARTRAHAVAADAIEAVAQRVQGGDRAFRLSRVGVLADAGPGVIGRAVPAAEQLGRGAQRGFGHAGDEFHFLRRPGGAGLRQQIEGRAAGDARAVLRRRFDRTAQAEVGRALSSCGPRGVVRHCPLVRIAPDHEAVAPGIGPQVTLAQQMPVVVAHQQRRIGPVAHEGPVEAVVLDQQADQPERERRIGAGPHRQPHIGLARQRRGTRVDHDHPRAFGAALRDGIGLRQPGVGRVVAPQHDQLGLRIVGRRHAAAEGEGMGEVLVPVADLGRIADVGAAEEAHEALDPVDAVGQRRAARRRDREHHRFGAALGLDGAQAPGGLGQRLFPTDAHPARIRIALGPRAAHRMQHAVRAVHELGRGLALHAHGLAGRVCRVGPHRHQHVAAHLVERAAARAAERAVAGLGVRRGRGHRSAHGITGAT